MHRKHLLILGLLVVVPLLAFLMLGRRLIQAEQDQTRRQFRTLLEANLAGIDRSIHEYFDTVEQRLLVTDIDPDDLDSIRAFARSEPLVEQILVLDADGTLTFPDPTQPLSQRETSYLLKIEQLISDRSLVRQRENESVSNRRSSDLTRPSRFKMLFRNRPVEVTLNGAGGSSLEQSASEKPNFGIASSSARDYGWYTWYWGNGIQLIHWRVLDDGRIVAVGLQRARWVADVIGMLPESDPNDQNRTAPSQIRLINAEGHSVYLWGANAEVAKDAKPVTALHLSPPLRPWQLQHFGPSNPFDIGTSATQINLFALGGLLSIGLLGLALYLSREISRETREAQQRVNFVNQVSHELKTPLTNIRMYADMLERDLERIDPDDEPARAHLSVITGESGRLSRLINNVLSFARVNRESPQSKPQSGIIDDVIHSVLEQFQLSLDKLGIKATLDLDAPQLVELDVDAFEQMLGNLIGNVEKYAADGNHLRIATRYRKGLATIDVSDAGPGISPLFAKRIFDPFERASDHIVSATGTGIGLGITRTLARRHGGDLVLRESSLGASFRLTLKTPLWENE